MKITNLYVENIKRIKVANINSDGKSTVVISGKNGNGKSSTMDAIAMALGGKDLIPSRPVRDGSKEAKIEVVTDKYRITRNWTSPEKSYLKVELKDGGELKSPQTILDDIVGNLSFDPLAFTTMEPKKRAEILKNLAGLNFEAIDIEHKRIYDERTQWNKEGQSIKGLLESFSDLPAELPALPDIKEIQEKKALDDAHNKRVDGAKVTADGIKKDNVALGEKANNYKESILKLTKDIETLRDQIGQVQGQIKHNESSIESHLQTANMPYRDTSAYDSQIIEFTQNESNKKRFAQKAEYTAKMSEARTEWENRNNKIKELAEQKETMIKNSKMPIEGLAVGEGEILFNNIPFGQLCTSEQIRISMSVAINLNPKLRVVMVKDGSLLDVASMKELSEIAEKNDFQVWVEKVSESPDGNSVFIEDGEVLEDSIKEEIPTQVDNEDVENVQP